MWLIEPLLFFVWLTYL